MKRLFPAFFALALLGLSACKREITFTAGTTGTVIDPTPANVSVDQNRGDVVIFINNDDRVHRIYVGTGAPPATATATTVYPPGSGATRPNTYTWPIPASVSPPATFTWTCVTHSESGTITVSP